jgi:hypothetical protein
MALLRQVWLKLIPVHFDKIKNISFAGESMYLERDRIAVLIHHVYMMALT